MVFEITFAIGIALILFGLVSICLMLMGGNRLDPKKREQDDQEQEAFCHAWKRKRQ